jgi:hypothetical protein
MVFDFPEDFFHFVVVLVLKQLDHDFVDSLISFLLAETRSACTMLLLPLRLSSFSWKILRFRILRMRLSRMVKRVGLLLGLEELILHQNVDVIVADERILHHMRRAH